MPKKTSVKRSRKKVPEFWWDLDGDRVIVESDMDDYPVIASFPFDPVNGGEPASGAWLRVMRSIGEKGNNLRIGQAAAAIRMAEKMVDDLKAGRINYRRAQ